MLSIFSLKKTLIILLFLSTFITPTKINAHDDDLPEEEIELVFRKINPYTAATPEPAWNKFLTRYATTLAISVPLGISTGTLCALLQKKLFNDSWIGLGISWGFVYGLRNVLVNSIQKDMDLARIPHNKTVLSSVAWLTDWLTYFTILYA